MTLSWLTRFLASGTLGLAVLAALAVPARGEWYAAGYGGYSADGAFRDVSMNNLGERLAFQRYNFSQTNVLLGDTLTQSFVTSDLKLKSSPLFGGKAGYFFNDSGFPWLGVEIEAYTTKPSIKSQTVTTTQDITFIKNGPDVPPCFPPPAQNCSRHEVLNSTLAVGEVSLRVTTVAFNVIARYPGDVFQPYVGVGVGAFYFSGSGQIDGRQVVPGFNGLAGVKILATEEWGLFVEGKYNRATLTNFDPNLGLSGEYSIFHFVGGIAYHF